MSIKKIWGTRTKVSADTHIGEKGSIFYDESTGVLRLSDGETPGGLPVTINAVSVVTDNLLPDVDNVRGIGEPTRRWNHLHIGDGGIYFDGHQTSLAQTVPYLPSALTGSLVPAADNGVNLGDTTHRFANLYLGYQGLFLADTLTDQNINIRATDGTLYLDGAQNLAVGNLVIVDTTLTSATNNLDISIGATDDTGFFYVKRKAQFDNTTWNDTEAMVSINGSGGVDPLTNFADTLVQATSRPNKSSRIVQRAYGSDPLVPANNSYAVWASYAARGTVTSPQPLQAGDILSRLSSNGLGKTGATSVWGSGGTRIESVALENFTATAKGSKINFYTTPVGQTTSQNVAAITATGMSAKAMAFQADLDLANGKVQQKAGIEWDQKGAVNGIASLDNNGKLTAEQIPDALTGAIVFKGVWNATTNTPALSDTTPVGLDIGWEYIVEVGGTRDIGDGSKTFLAGDFIIYDGTHWKQVPSGNAFISLTSGGHITVNQTTGAMTLGSDATSSSTNNTIVARDSSGSFSANVITANLTGTVTGSVTGNAGTVTNGVYTTGIQSIDGTKTFTSTIQGSISGNAGTVTNGVYTTGSYANPAWITSLDYSKLSGTVPTTYSSVYLGTTSVAFNRASGSLSLAGVSIDGNAGTVTNGVYTSGSYSDPSWLTISKSKVGLGSVDNTSDATKNVLYATTAGGAPATDVYAWAKAATKPTYTATEVGLGNVTNESKATMFTSPTFTGTVSGVTKAMVGLSAVENTALSTWAGSSNITTVGTLGSLSVTATITGSVSGNAGTVTNGVYTTGDQTIAGIKTFTAINTGKISATNSSSSTSTTGAISYGTNSYTDTGLMANFTSSIAGYNQVIIQNTSAATTASANLILSNNLGTATTNYGEIGINSSTFTGSGSANIPGAVYIGAANGDLVFGTNTNKAIHFYTNSSTTDALTISGAGVATFTQTIVGSINGNAGTVTNGVYTTGSYSDPSWLTISKSKVGLGNVDNTADANKNVLYATTAGGAPATDVYAWAKAATKPTYTATDVGLGNVTNESKATMFTSPIFTGTVSGVTKAMVGLGSVENTALSTSTHFIGTTSITYNRASASQTLTGVSIDGNAGTVTNGVITTGSYSDPSWLTISAAKVGLGNVTNESKATMFTSPTFTGTVAGVTATMVGLGNVTNESKATMFTSPTFTGTVAGVTKAMVGLGSVENTALSTWAGSSNITTVGTLGSLSVTATITGSVSGNAGTVTNGVYTSGSYSDPSWLTISKSKVGLSAVENTALSTWAGSSNITTVGTLTSGTIGSGFTAIANARLANSTISGVALGSTLNALTAGFNIGFSTGTTYDGSAAITINNQATVTPSTTAGAITVDFSGSGWLTYAPSTNAAVTVTLQNFVPGRTVRMFITFNGAGQTYTVTNLTVGQSFNGKNNFKFVGGIANCTTMIAEFHCTTNAVGGVYLNVINGQ